MPKPHLVNVLSHLDSRFGGVSTSLPPFSEAVVDHLGWDTTMVAFIGPDERLPRCSKLVIRTFPLGSSRWFVPKALQRELSEILRSASLVQIHGIWQEHCTVTAGICRQFKIPYLIAAHGMLEPWAMRQHSLRKQLYWRLVEKRNLSGASLLRSLTSAETGHYRRMGLTNPLIEVPNGINIPQSLDPGPFFERHPHLRGRRIVLFLGRLHAKKGVHMLCQVWTRVARSFPDTVLVLAGPDSAEGTRAELEAVVINAQLERQVLFTGMLDSEEKLSALAASSLFVLPSFSEGFSIAVLEALGAGVPVLLSDTCYFPDAAAKGCGWEIKPDAATLERTLTEALLESEHQRDSRTRAARNLIRESYTWEAVVNRFANGVSQLIHAN